jgi:hypothetical protein
MKLFGPKAAKEKNYKQMELDLYTSLTTFRSILQKDELEDGCYVVGTNEAAYRKCFNFCYGLLKFYTKHSDESKEFKFKRNFLLSKTRGIFSDQKLVKTKFLEAYYIEPKRLDRMIA